MSKKYVKPYVRTISEKRMLGVFKTAVNVYKVANAAVVTEIAGYVNVAAATNAAVAAVAVFAAAIVPVVPQSTDE